MNYEEFRQLVLERAPANTPILSALEDYRRGHGPHYQQNEVSRVYKAVPRGSLVGHPTTPQEEAGRALFADTPWGRTVARDRLKAIGPWVADLRDEVTRAAAGRVTLPLASMAQAVEWIEQEGARSKKENDSTRVDSRGFRWPTLAYIKPGSGQVIHMLVGTNSPLATLARGVAEMSKATMFPEASLTLHVLTDYRPRLGPVRITTRPGWHQLPSGGGLSRMEVEVAFRTPEISFKQLRAIHTQIKKEWGSAREKPLTRRDELLIQEVESAPESATWREKMRRVNRRVEEAGEKRFPSPDAVRVAYREARKKLPHF